MSWAPIWLEKLYLLIFTTMRIIAFAVLSLATLITLQRDDPTLLTWITSSGANTFGCRIDNKIYVPGNGQAGTRAEILNDRILVRGGADYVSISLQVIDSLQPIVAINHITSPNSAVLIAIRN